MCDQLRRVGGCGEGSLRLRWSEMGTRLRREDSSWTEGRAVVMEFFGGKGRWGLKAGVSGVVGPILAHPAFLFGHM